MPETDRRRNRSDSAKQQGGSSKATKKSGGSEPRGSCEVHKLPAHDVDGNDIYTLTGAGKRCSCRVNVEDFVVTVHGWSESEDVRLCPNHFLQLYKRSDVLEIETIAECASRLLKAGGRCRRAGRTAVSPRTSARFAAELSTQCSEYKQFQGSQSKSKSRKSLF